MTEQAHPDEIAAALAKEAQRKFTLIDLNEHKIELRMNQFESVLEVREFLSEHVQTVFFTNF